MWGPSGLGGRGTAGPFAGDNSPDHRRACWIWGFLLPHGLSPWSPKIQARETAVIPWALCSLGGTGGKGGPSSTPPNAASLFPSLRQSPAGPRLEARG